MGYSKQRMANTFGDWTKIRKREDSNGQMIFQPFAKVIDEEVKNLFILKNTLKLKSDNLESSDFYVTYLEEGEEIIYDQDSDKFIYPVVINLRTGQEITRYDRWEEFYYGVPTKLVLVDERNLIQPLLWDKRAERGNGILIPALEMPRAEHLGILVSGSSYYNSNRTAENGYMPFGGYYGIRLVGLNENFEEVSEFIRVIDDGYFETRNVFRKITEIDYDGFDGNIQIFFGRRSGGEAFNKKYKFELATTLERQGGMEVEALTDNDRRSFLRWKLVLQNFGLIYRNQYDQEEMETLKYHQLYDSLLLDEYGREYLIQDFFINPINSRIYILDNEGSVHVHEFYLTDFVKSHYLPTKHSVVKLESSKQRVGLEEEQLIDVTRLNQEARVEKYMIQVRDPDGIISYFTGITGAKQASFDTEEVWINGVDHPLPENSWKDFAFYYKYNKAGQYDWNIVVETPLDIYSYNYSVVCESNRALKSFATTIPNLNSIYLSKENYICVEDEESSYYFKEEKEGCFGDFSNQRFIFLKKYVNIAIEVE